MRHPRRGPSSRGSEAVRRRPARPIPGDRVRIVAPAEGEGIRPARAAARRVLPLRLGREAERQRAAGAGHGGQDLARVEAIEKAARAGDMIPGHVVHRAAKIEPHRGVRAHHAHPQRLRHRRARDMEVADFDGPAGRVRTEQVRRALGPWHGDEAQLVLRAAVAPCIRERRHLASIGVLCHDATGATAGVWDRAARHS